MRTGGIHRHFFAGDRDPDIDVDWFRHLVPAAVHIIRKGIFSVRDLRDRTAHHPFRIILHLFHAVRQHVPVLGIGGLYLFDADQVRGDLGSEIAFPFFFGPGISEQHVHNVVIDFSVFADMDDRDPDTFFKDRTGIADNTARDTSPDI